MIAISPLSIILLSGMALALFAAKVDQTEAGCTISSSIPAVDDDELPDPFKFANGTEITTKADFDCRAQEISLAMQQYELGDYPPPPDSVTGSISGNTITVAVTVGSKSISYTASITKPSGDGPFPAIITVGGASIPIPSTVATITFNNDQFAAQDSSSSRGQGLFYNLFGASHSAGALTAWAWGVDRLIDALEQVNATSGIDTTHLGVTGCSRNGKGAFIVGALVKRIALTIPQESGSGGAAVRKSIRLLVFHPLPLPLFFSLILLLSIMQIGTTLMRDKRSVGASATRSMLPVRISRRRVRSLAKMCGSLHASTPMSRTLRRSPKITTC